MLCIYKLTRIEMVYYDEADCFIVIAPTEHAARVLASTGAGDEGYTAWLDSAKSSCEMIGAGDESQAPCIVCRSFNAA
jgi:hypothetical protein